jgi:hypothetical protein
VRIRFLLVGGNRPPYDADGHSERDVSSPERERLGTAEGTSPWYLKRWVLALWGLAVVILIATIIYGLTILAKGGGGGTPATTTTRPSTSAPSSSLTPSSALPTTEAPSTSTETTEPDLPTTPPWTQQQHPHRHWWRNNLPPIPAIPHF